MPLNKLTFLVVLLLLTTTVYAATITTEPDELVFENVLSNGYAEKIIKISSDSPEQVHISFSATRPIDGWISFEPALASVSETSPLEFKIIVKPSNATLGIYQGYLIVNTLSEGDDLTTAVSTARDLKTTIEVTDDEITNAVIKDVVVENVKQTDPIKVSVTVQNQGNIAVTPFFTVDLLDVTKSQKIKSTVSDKKMILPSSTDVIEIEVPNDLALGAYWAHVTIFVEHNWVLGKWLIRFNVIEEGAPEEPVPVFKEGPIPLSTSPVILVIWALILVFVVWKVSKKKPKEER